MVYDIRGAKKFKIFRKDSLKGYINEIHEEIATHKENIEEINEIIVLLLERPSEAKPDDEYEIEKVNKKIKQYMDDLSGT